MYSVSIIINTHLAIYTNVSYALYILLNLFGIYQGFIGIKRLKIVGLDTLEHLRDKIEEEL